MNYRCAITEDGRTLVVQLFTKDGLPLEMWLWDMPREDW